MWIIIVSYLNYEDLKWFPRNNPGYKRSKFLEENNLQRWVNDVFSEYITSICLGPDRGESYGIHRLSLDNLSKIDSNNILNIYKDGKYITRFYAQWVY